MTKRGRVLYTAPFLKYKGMFKVKKGFENNTVSTHFVVRLGDATQEQLEELYHLGVREVESDGKKPKVKKGDNAEGEPTPEPPTKIVDNE
jgi:hypothetical protein